MFEEEIKRQRETLYKIYNEEVKPLVAEIEARFEEFPEPLLAEMFFFNDYMAQGYREPVTEEQFEESIKSAFAHLEKVKLYLYIYLNAALVQVIELFEEQTRNVDMKDINDGEFLKEYSEMKKEAENKLKHAQEREEWLSVEVEVRSGKINPALQNEIRAFNDHIARCYYDSEVPVDETLVIEKQKKEIDKAEGHIRRLILDCFKQLNASLSDTLKRHEKKMKYMDPVRMGKSNEWNTYRELKVCAVEAVYNAKIQESINTEKSMELFEKSYLQYRKLEELFDQQAKYIHKERINAVVGFIKKGVVWLILLLVSSFLSVLFGDFLLNLF